MTRCDVTDVLACLEQYLPSVLVRVVTEVIETEASQADTNAVTCE